MKYASLAGAGLLTMSLVGCASEPQQPLTLGDKMNQSGVQSIQNSSVANKCKDSEPQKDGSYKCEGGGGSNGSHGGTSIVPFWFFNGHTYSSHNAMTNSSDYKANNLVSGTKNSFSKVNSSTSNSSKNGSNSSKSSSSSSKSGGFGSGGRGGSGGS